MSDRAAKPPAHRATPRATPATWNWTCYELVPAPPQTFALLRRAGDARVYREPVLYFARYDEWLVDTLGRPTSPASQCVGALLFTADGALEPASRRDGFAGIRVGDWRELDGRAGFDTPERASEPGWPET